MWVWLPWAACILIFSGVSAFAQSNTRTRGTILLARSALNVAREYVPPEGPDVQSVTIPANVVAGPVLRSLIELMLRRSSTFRRQLQRLEYAPMLTVTIKRAHAMASGTRARTQIVRHQSGGLEALIEVPPLDDDVELIAHEIEHVIEQLDDVDLATKAALAGTGVETTPAGERAFETARAVRAGLTVTAEVQRAGR